MRPMILPARIRPTAIRPTLVGSIVIACGLLASLPAAARTACDSYGRCFDFSGPSDRLGDSAALWRRSDVAEANADVSDTAGIDPLALAHGTIGDSLQGLADDD